VIVRQHSAAGRRGGISYLGLLTAPFRVFAARLIQDWLPPEWVVAAALSFIGWLFVRRR